MQHPNSRANLRRGNPGNRGRPTNQMRFQRALWRLFDVIDGKTGAVNEQKLHELHMWWAELRAKERLRRRKWRDQKARQRSGR